MDFIGARNSGAGTIGSPNPGGSEVALAPAGERWTGSFASTNRSVNASLLQAETLDSDRNSTGIDPGHDLWPNNLEKPSDEFVLWGDSLPADPDNPYEAQFGHTILADKVLEAVRVNALKRAGDLCRNGCCKQVRTRLIWVERGGKKLIHKPTIKQTDYEGKIRIQDMVVNCKTWSYSYVDR